MHKYVKKRLTKCMSRCAGGSTGSVTGRDITYKSLNAVQTSEATSSVLWVARAVGGLSNRHQFLPDGSG